MMPSRQPRPPVFPPAMKVESPDIAHKTEAGVIALNIRDEQQLRQEFRRISDAALRAASADRINGRSSAADDPAGC